MGTASEVVTYAAIRQDDVILIRAHWHAVEDVLPVGTSIRLKVTDLDGDGRTYTHVANSTDKVYVAR